MLPIYRPSAFDDYGGNLILRASKTSINRYFTINFIKGTVMSFFIFGFDPVIMSLRPRDYENFRLLGAQKNF